MTDINEVHSIIRQLLVQEKTGKSTPEEIDKALDLAQIDYFNSLRPQQGAQMPVYAQGTYVAEALNPFLRTVEFNNANTPSGLMTIPQSEQLLTVMTQNVANSVTLYSPVPVVNPDELAHRLRSQIVMPTEADPVVIFETNKKLQFYPAAAKAGKVIYLVLPTKPKWGYLEDGRNLKYSPARSTDLEWNVSYIPQVITRALQYLGVSLSADAVFQVAQQKQMEVR